MKRNVYKLLNEQFNIGNMDLNNKHNRNMNIYNKNIIDPQKIYNNIINGLGANEYEIKSLNDYTAVTVARSEEDLQNIVNYYSKSYPYESLNWLDVSGIDDMHNLFSRYDENYLDIKDIIYNGDISQWDVSNVRNMRCMFEFSIFTGNIYNWDVSNVTDMSCMFYDADFNGNISRWDVSSVITMNEMFAYSRFNSDISGWDVINVKYYSYIFNKCDIKEEYIPKRFRKNKFFKF